MAPETLPHVFNLFMQADRSLAREGGGLGIGLTVVKNLVHAHRGSVEGYSEGLRKGSEFVVRLPMLRLEDAPTRSEMELRNDPQGAAPGAGLPRRVLRILVVDDNVDTAESLAALLRLAGHRVETAHDGPAALEASAAFTPEIVLLDIGLPGMDGYEVAYQLRRQMPSPRTLLVALTGYGRSEDRQHAQEAGFDHHLTKPVTPEALTELIDRFTAPVE
jgi:two-component system CheB/CheR fusion protein